MGVLSRCVQIAGISKSPTSANHLRGASSDAKWHCFLNLETSGSHRSLLSMSLFQPKTHSSCVLRSCVLIRMSSIAWT